jgi:F-type H+-transporting ATPase subunit epsilon
MSNTLTINIISPGKDPFIADVESFKTVSVDGEVEFMANHTPIIVSTIPGTTILKSGVNEEKFFTSSGIITIKDNVLRFCCDAFEKSSDIDITRAEDSKNRAKNRIEEQKNIDIERAKRSLARANARLNTVHS